MAIREVDLPSEALEKRRKLRPDIGVAFPIRSFPEETQVRRPKKFGFDFKIHENMGHYNGL
jgi:hypothetical protein